MVCGQIGATGMELLATEALTIPLRWIMVGMRAVRRGELRGIISGMVRKAVSQ